MKKIMWFLFVVILTSCKEDVSFEGIKIKIDISNTPLSEIGECFSSDTIYFETLPASLIGIISRVSFVNDNILVADFRNDKLMLFSHDGKFIGNIGRKGQGPGEYIKIHDYFIKDNAIYIYDFSSRKILKYTLDGQYIDQYAMLSSFDKIVPTPDGKGYLTLNTFSNKDNNSKFSWLDNDFKLVASVSQKRKNGMSLPNMFFAYKKHILYWEMMNNIIYSIEGNQISSSYKVDFLNYNIPNELNDIEKKIDYYTQNYSKAAGFINNVIETDSLLCFTFVHNLCTYWTVYNKSDNKYKIFKMAKNGEMNTLQYILSASENYFIGVYMPDNLTTDNNPSIIKYKYNEVGLKGKGELQ